MLKYFVPFLLIFFGETTLAWEANCDKDDFTDEKVCTLVHKESANLVIIAHTDDRSHLALGVSTQDAESYADRDGPFLLRVDENDAIDLMEADQTVGQKHMLAAILDAELGSSVFSQLLDGSSLKVRVGNLSGYDDAQFDLDGFDGAWRKFAETSPLEWVNDIASK